MPSNDITNDAGRRTPSSGTKSLPHHPFGSQIAPPIRLTGGPPIWLRPLCRGGRGGHDVAHELSHRRATPPRTPPPRPPPCGPAPPPPRFRRVGGLSCAPCPPPGRPPPPPPGRRCGRAGP